MLRASCTHLTNLHRDLWFFPKIRLYLFILFAKNYIIRCIQMVWDRSALRPFIYWRLPYYVHVHRLQPASAGQCKKDPLHRLRRQRHVSSDPDPGRQGLRDLRQRRAGRQHHPLRAGDGREGQPGPQRRQHHRCGHGGVFRSHLQGQRGAVCRFLLRHPHHRAQRAAGLCEPSVQAEHLRVRHPRQDHHYFL